jgi:hypothetical protein
MKSFYYSVVIYLITIGTVIAQCPEQQPVNLSTVPDNCNQAIVLTPYIQNCQTVCFSGATATTSGGVSDLSCFGGSSPNDVWLTAPNPYNAVPNYDGSLVFRWIDWPNKANGVANPNISIHAEIAGSAAGGLVTINIDCTSPAPTQSNNFAQENAFCIQNSSTTGNQFYGVAGTIPTVSQIPPPSGVTINNIQYYLQIVPADGARGNYCFDVSTYKPGFLCGDALPISLTGSGGTLTGSASGCLCASALNGSLFSNSSNNLPVPCGIESPSSAWYAINLPYACNKVSLSLSSWGGSGNYNLALVSGVNCPGTTGVNPYTGATIFTPGQTLQPGAVVEAGSCGQPLNLCRTLSAGTYYVYISGATERPTYTVNVSVQEVIANVGTVTSPQHNQSVCSGSSVDLVSSGSVLPLAQSCGQNLLWYISSNLNFNPYNNQGTLLGLGTTSMNFPLPANNTCAPITYYIKGIISDNGTTPQSGCKQTANIISVTVYPSIGQVTLLNQPCIISAAPRCSTFTVNGQTGTFQAIGNFAQDGEPVNFTVSNGLSGCEITVTDTMHCSGNCDQPVASPTVTCNPNDTYNYYVDVDFTPGSAASYTIVGSDSSELQVTNAGTYLVGPFTNGTTVSLSVTNTEDANCNIPLGNFTQDCNPLVCPNLTDVTATLLSGGTSTCEGGTVLLQATVDQGNINQDFKIQWYVNGNAIAGATTISYTYTTDPASNCAAELQEYSAKITCLRQNASPSQTPQLTAATSVNVFPVPVIGTDFIPPSNNCAVAPIDLCGGLDMVYSPTTNQLPGAGNVTVDYTVKVSGAPSGCSAIGTYMIQCPPSGCGSSAGTGTTPADNVICYGEQFTLSTPGATLDNGYSIGYAWTTTNPYNNIEVAIQSAIAANQYLGPYAATATPSFTNNGSTFQYGTYYFIPFVALNIPANQLAYTASGSFSVSAPFGGGSASITVPSNITYCSGITAYTANLTVQQQSNTGVLNAIDGVSGPIVTYTGGSTTNLNLNNTNFTGNPNGAVTTINGSGNLFWGSAINYTFTLRHQAVPFPSRCGSCPDYGSPVVLKLLPQITLSNITAPQICVGESVQLTDYNPTANMQGRIVWYNGNPSSGGTVISNTSVTPSAGGSTYWALFKSADDSTCTAVTSFTITPGPAPAVNQLPPPAAICAGTTVDLTALNSAVSNAPGTVVWYRGNPVTNPNAVRLPDAVAASQQPINGARYCAKFTDAGTGCFAYTCLTFTVKPKPALTAPSVNPSSCEGIPFDLNTLEPGLTANAGTFVWYEGNPNSGGIQLTAQQEAAVNLTPNNLEYCTIFTDSATTCENRICLNFNINPLPVLTRLPAQGPLCSNQAIDLVALQSQITSENGTWTWKDENGTVVTTPDETYAQQNTFFSATFVNSLTNCSDTLSVNFIVNPTPALTAPVINSVCIGDTVKLTGYESQMTTATGTFTWYKGDSINFGVALTVPQSQLQFPTNNNVYRAVFETPAGCADTQSVQFVVNTLPVLNSVPTRKICFGVPANLTLLNDSFTTTAGTFTWYAGINATGTALTLVESQAQTITGNVSYTVKFTDTNGCKATKTIVLSSLPELTGGSASYSCALNQLVVNLSGITGGAGGGYNIAPNSPNQNGETLANGSNYTVIISDSLGCTITFSGTVSCLVCAVGSSVADADTACCNGTLHLEPSGIATSPNYTIGWGISAVADGAISSSADVAAAAAAGYVWQANADGSFDFVNQCPNIPAGNYYFTPFIIEDPVTTPLVYDTLNGCRPDGQICPTFSTNLDWKVDTFMGVFPSGDTIDLIRKLTENLLGIPGGVDFDIDQTLLTDLLGGALPCLQLTALFAGNPNGTWTFIVNNIGTGPLVFNVPDFEITVSADSCAALNGTDQVVVVPGTTVPTPPNGQYVSISFQIPPLPLSFPAINSACEAYGTGVQVFITDDVNVCTSGIDDGSALFTHVSLVPNPAQNMITINAELKQQENITVTAVDVMGKEVYQYADGKKTKRFTHAIDVSAYAAGVYLFKIKAGDVVKSVRMVKL